jgi:hypothetical protein
MSIATLRNEFTDQYDRLMVARKTILSIEKTAEGVLAHARPVLALMKLERLPATGSAIRDIEIDVLRVEADQELSRKLLSGAEKNAEECSAILSRLSVYQRVETSDHEVEKWENEFGKALWHLSASIEEIQALRAQMEGTAASLEKRLPL